MLDTLKTTGIHDAIIAAGSQTQLADQLGVTPQLISQWMKRGFVSINYVIAIESQFGIPRARLVNPKHLRLFTPVTFTADV